MRISIILVALGLTACNNSHVSKSELNHEDSSTGYSTDSLPEPFATASVTNTGKMVSWGADVPKAPTGFVVTKFAEGLKNPRWMYQLPNGDVLIAETGTRRSANQIRIFRDANKDGKPDQQEVFLSGLNQPLGMLLLNNKFYVGNTDGVSVYDYSPNALRISGAGKKILNLPAGGYNNHWTRNLLANKDGSKIYVSVGSGSNVAEHGIEHEVRRANILEINPDGSGEKIYASGLRNPVGMDWAPGTNTLWTAVNERDELGDELVPDYATSVKAGGFYGWPYSYFGQHKEPRMKDHMREDLVSKTIVPDVPLGSHTASLGLAFYDRSVFPARYRNGMFIGQHGSWNRSVLSGYKVLFVPFANGRPSGKPEDFLTGFISDLSKSEFRGRPVGVTVLQDGSLLVADDVSNTVWRVSYQK